MAMHLVLLSHQGIFLTPLVLILSILSMYRLTSSLTSCLTASTLGVLKSFARGKENKQEQTEGKSRYESYDAVLEPSAHGISFTCEQQSLEMCIHFCSCRGA